MKRLFTLLAAALLTAAVASAQDVETINAAAETYNNGAIALENGNKTEALAMFRQALTMFEACGEEGVEKVAQCKDIIPSIMLSIAKDQINNAEYDTAIESLKGVAATAGEYGLEDIAAEADALVPDVLNRKGTALFKAKDFAAAIPVLREFLALQPENGQAYLKLGQSLMGAGQTDEAVEAFKSAAANGQEAQANKQIGNILLKKGQALLKGGKAVEAAAAIEEALQFSENAGAYKLLASACMKAGKTPKAIDAYKKYLEAAPDAKDAADIVMTIAATAQKEFGKTKKASDKATAIEYYSKLTGDAKYGETAKQQLAALKK